MTKYIGQKLGNYRVVRLLGEGGFAEVYLGEHIFLNTQVAIKIINTQLTKDAIKLFLDEARTVAHLKHPNIVQVFDFGIEEERIPFLVMNYASHGSLLEKHPRGSQLPPETVVSYVQQVASALQYAHDQKLIHRDVKPANMLLGEKDEVMLSDFGLVTAARSTTSINTQNVAGTFYYSAPEQIQGKPRLASDQYSLGVVAYEWLCGTPPFTEGDAFQLGYQHIHEPVPSLQEKHPTISPRVEAVIMRALAKKQEERFASVQEFARALEEACNGAEPSKESVRCAHCGGLVQKEYIFCPICGKKVHEAAEIKSSKPEARIAQPLYEALDNKQKNYGGYAPPTDPYSGQLPGYGQAYNQPQPQLPAYPQSGYAPTDPYSSQLPGYGQVYPQSGYAQPSYPGPNPSQQPPAYPQSGYAQPSYPQLYSAPVGAASSTGLAPNVAAGLSYVLGFLTGLIFVLIERKNRLVRFHAMQSLLFNSIFGIVNIFLPHTGVVIFAIIELVVWIILMINGFQGKYFKLPLIGDYAEKYANKGTI